MNTDLPAEPQQPEVLNAMGIQNGRPTSVKELVEETNAALEKMSNKNPHKRLIHKLCTGLVQVAMQAGLMKARIAELEAQLEQPKSRLILP